MQQPHKRTSMSLCEAASLYVETMCSKFPNNPTLATIATSLRDGRIALAQSHAAYQSSVLDLLPLRVEVRFSDYLSDQQLRRTQKLAEIFDGAPAGRTSTAVYPNGITPIVKPIGTTQVEEMRLLEGRLQSIESTWGEAASERAKITELRMRYEHALEARKEGTTKVANLRAMRDSVKEDFLDLFAVAVGRIKTEFPRNHPMQELFFDRIDDKRRRSTESDTESDDTEEPSVPVEG